MQVGLRRTVAAITSGVLVVEGVGMALLNFLLGHLLSEQKMSLAGLDTSVMANATRVAGVVFGAYLLLVGIVLALTVVRDRAPGTFARLLLISAAVVHGVIGAVAVGLLGWGVFVAMMVILGLLVFSLINNHGNGALAGDGGADAPTPTSP
ncbi:hypothetical protein G5C51_33040 [Streptomyces sp. A7024]|uniref:Integral membrane protein n=1 Tax=Streptomyces coryli TaxID=1128680 RepID=A0A6G4U941_9ACTN|nr:hypothetical protein [Streptomyces coryli]NGN68704.1 hypothetical protein [Streptomyces coryli]